MAPSKDTRNTPEPHSDMAEGFESPYQEFKITMRNVLRAQKDT
jgi:hypothetical protein